MLDNQNKYIYPPISNSSHYGIIEHRKSQKRSLGKYLFFTFLILALGFGVLYYDRSNPDEIFIISPLARTIDGSIYSININENNEALEKIVQNILQEDKDNYAVVIENLNNGKRYYLNEDMIFETASLYKLWAMAVAYQKIEEGRLNKTDILSNDVLSLNKKFNIATESAELTEGVVSWSVQDALRKMIVVSDNYSAFLLVENVGLSNISKFLEKYKLSDSKVGTLDYNPYTSARDIASFLRQLYNNKFVNKEKTDEMIDLLKDQGINTKLSNMLPEEAVIAHKTGELDKFSHDGGIVYSPKGNYIIVVLSETENTLIANENIAKISRDIYGYFTK